jgi:hypothetical protein
MTRDFLYLFRGNPAAVGLDDSGRGRPGPLRLDVPDERTGKWTALAEGHLAGHLGIGVYPYRSGLVTWGCIDFDEGEVASWSHALNVKALLADVDMPTWVERSRSKGYHLWLFAGNWTPAKAMRQLLLGACATVDAPGKEVNPKSERLDEGQLGNFVRLPYFGIGKGPISRQVVVDLMGESIPLDAFVEQALAGCVTADRVVQVARLLYVAPRAPTVSKGTAHAGPWQERLNGLAAVQFQEGPKGEDRSSYLFAFGLACAESGLDETEIVKAVRVADLIHTHKYEARKDAPTRYEDIATKAIIRTQEAAR